MLRRPECPCCGAGDTVLFQQVVDYSVSSKPFHLSRCVVCGFIFTEDAPSREDIGQYYRSEAYVSHTDSTRGIVNWLYHRVRKFTVAGKRRMAEQANSSRPGRILDYGCGTGAFLASMRDAGWDVVGLEPDAIARANASRLHGLSIDSPDALETQPDGCFDVITLWHVLEHVHDLHGTLAQLSRVLAPHGTIFIAVPNPLSWDASHYGPAWAAWDVPRHLWHFTPEALSGLLRQYGLRVEHRKPMWFDSFYVAMLSEKYAHGRLRLFPALWAGARSNGLALHNRNRCSSLIHIARHSSNGKDPG